MAIEKIISTRVLNKIDTLENWNKSTLKIKQGEICLATVAASAGTGLTEPVVMAKIGNSEEKTFAELPWSFYAKASDVLSACKSEEGLKTFINNVIAEAGIATSEAMEALSGRVTKLEGDENTAGSVAKAIKDAIDALDYSKVEASETNGNIKIDGVETVVYTHPEKHAIADVDGLQDALDGKQAAGDYATKTEAKGYADAKDGAIQEAKQAGLDAVSALETYKGEMVTALAGKQDVIPENTYDAYGAAAQALEDAKKYADENDADTQYGIEYDSVTKKIKLVSDTSKTEIDATDFIKDGMIESVALSEDGLNLVITWNTDSDKGENNVTTIPLTGLVDIYTGVDGTTVTVSVSSDDKISAEVKTGSLKDGHIASDAAIAKGKLAADVQASLGKADTALQEHQDISHLATTEALNGVDTKFANYTNTTDMNAALELKADKTQVAADIEAAKTEASNQSAVVLSEAQKYTDAEVAKDRERLTLLEAIEHNDYVKKADAPGYDDILTKTDAQGLYQAKGEYASAEQGAKADSALQSITTTENGGLKVTNNNQIDIDDTIVFILDCGNATV